MKTRIISKLLAASVLVGVASLAQAAVVTEWDYTASMKWTEAVFTNSTNPLSKTTFTPTLLSWGSSAGIDGYQAPFLPASQARSSVQITTPYSAGKILTGTSVQQVNMFTHTNNEILATVADLKQATLHVDIGLSTNGVTLSSIPKDFTVYFYETPNTGGTCAWGNCNDDIFALIQAPQIYDRFMFDGQEYQLNYFQTSGPGAIKLFDAATCSAASRGVLTTSCYGFTTVEGAKTTLQFGLSVTAVPEPETYAMLLAGLGLVGVIVRRRRDIRA